MEQYRTSIHTHNGVVQAWSKSCGHQSYYSYLERTSALELLRIGDRTNTVQYSSANIGKYFVL